MKRQTRAFLECAKNSLILAIEMFNRPSDAGRVEAVLLFLDHAFEMLSKAVVLEKTGRIRAKREKFNYSFEKCLNIIQSQINLIDEDEALILKNLNGFRDAAAHDLVDISEGLLYGHAQSAVKLFTTILKKVFRKDITDALPRRILPISTVPPSDINALIAQDMACIVAMLGSGKRREDEAEAKLHPYEIIEKNIRSIQDITDKVPPTSRILNGLKTRDWKTVFPMVAGLAQSTPDGIPLSFHVTKGQGFPVRIDPNAPAAIVFRYVKPEDKYPYLTGELADKLGITNSKLIGFIKVLQLKGKDEFHISIKTSKSGHVQRYSEKSWQVIGKAIQTEGVENLWIKVKNSETLDPAAYR
jgi:uncharacterized protein YutE (UPF0331/DUF86 family)